MILRPTLLPIVPDESLSPAQRVQLQRRVARQALSLCARASGVPDGPWSQDPGGVPLPAGGNYWSISHKPLLAAAVVSDQAVGIDVERLVPRGNEGLWVRVAGEDEWALFGSRDWPTFYRLWTSKEATLKANGRGIGGLEDCRVVAVPDHTHVVLAYAKRRWTVEQFYHGDHVCAVTCRSGKVRWEILGE